MFEAIGFVLLAYLFLHAAWSHVKNHDAMVGYTISSLGDCPVAPYVGWFGGWPTGSILAIIGALIAFQSELGLALAAGFLAVTGLVFHRNLNDPANLKHLALLGAVVALLAA